MAFKTLYNTIVSHTKALKELRSIKQIVVTGAGANTNMAITGILPTDTLISVIQHAGTVAAAPIDRTSVTSITSAGNIQCTQATNTNSAALVVTYCTK